MTAAAAVLATVGLASAAQAGFVLDLRLAGGGTSTTVAPNTPVSLQVWGEVTGTGAGASGLQDAFFGVTNNSTAVGVMSQVSLAGLFTGVATDTGTNVTTSYGGSTFANAGGTAIGTGSNGSATGWVFARSTSMVTAANAGAGNSNSITNGTEFLLGSLTFTPTATSGTATITGVPRTNNGSTLIVPALWQQDGTTIKDGSAGDYTVGSSVTITIQSIISLAGDLNHDGFVGVADLNLVLGNWGQTVTPGDNSHGETSGDNFVGVADLNIVLGNWGQGTPPSAPIGLVTAVPEPTSLGLLLAGGLGLVARRRR